MTSLLAGCALVALLAGQAPEKGACTVYMYLDDQGNSHKTRNIDSVPADKKNAVITYQDCSVEFDKKPSFSYIQTEQNASGLTEDLSEATQPSVEWIGKESATKWLRRRARELDRWQVILALIGLAAFLSGLVGTCVSAFRASPWWVLGVLILPILPAVFAIPYWRESRASFAAWLAGGLLASLVVFLA